MMGAVMAEVFAPAEAAAAATHPPVSARVTLVGLTAFLVWFGRMRSRELLLHANLGTRPGWFWGASLLTAALADTVAQALLSAF